MTGSGYAAEVMRDEFFGDFFVDFPPFWMGFEEDSDELRIELATREVFKFFVSDLESESFAIGSRRGHRIKGIHDQDDAGS